MLCKSPGHKKGKAFPCGRCMPCRVGKRRLWCHRLLLESLKHERNSFITLTYSDENLPEGGTLVKKHAQLFIKRLRERISPLKLRYYIVGEYGDETERPHYHAALFGIGREYSEEVHKAWGLGHTLVGDLTPASAMYIVGYVTKKMTHDEKFCTAKCKHPPLRGRSPEFARMSLKPGLGGDSVTEIRDALVGYLPDGDVPLSLRSYGRQFPLGRYLRQKLRESYGLEKATPKEVLSQLSEKMCQVQEEKLQEQISKGKTIQEAYDFLKQEKDQKILNMEKRFKIMNQKGDL